MKTGVLDMEMRPTQPAPEPQDALVPAPAVGMFERLALDPNVGVDKLERLIAMNERILAHNAKAAFNVAFTLMQAELPEIGERGEIMVKGVLRSRYAKLEDIQAAIKPILKAHGFALRHRTEWPAEKASIIRIVGILSHAEGHSEESIFEAPADKSDYRTDIQSMGSTVSYGRRYTTLDLLNITTRGVDNDGQKQPELKDIKAPEGFDNWWTDMQATADSGMAALTTAWNGSKKAFTAHLIATNRTGWEALKTRARQVAS